MKRISVACAFWCVVVCLLVSGCGRSEPGKDQDTHIQPVAVPAGLTNWYVAERCLSPDGRFVALHTRGGVFGTTG